MIERTAARFVAWLERQSDAALNVVLVVTGVLYLACHLILMRLVSPSVWLGVLALSAVVTYRVIRPHLP